MIKDELDQLRLHTSEKCTLKKLMHVLHPLIIISFIFEKKLLPSSENTVIGNIHILNTFFLLVNNFD